MSSVKAALHIGAVVFIHRFGSSLNGHAVLAPNSPLRAAVTAMAAPAQPATVQTEAAIAGLGTSGPAPPGDAVPPVSEPAPPKRAAHYMWAVSIARIYKVLPLLCPLCGRQMRIWSVIPGSTRDACPSVPSKCAANAVACTCPDLCFVVSGQKSVVNW